MTKAYTAGWNAFYDDIEHEDNPHYIAFGDLPQEFFDWSKGWYDAEDAWYRKLDDDESANWQECLLDD